MTKIKELQLYCTMIICYFYALSVMITTCAPSPMGSETSTSRARRKRKSLVDPSVEKISQNFQNFVEMVGPGFKSLARNEARKKAREAAREERKKLLPQVIFKIEGLSNDEAMFILQVLSKDDDDLKILLDLPDNKKLRFCRVLLSRLSFSPPNMFLLSSGNSRFLTDPFGGISVYRCSPTAGACSEV